MLGGRVLGFFPKCLKWFDVWNWNIYFSKFFFQEVMFTPFLVEENTYHFYHKEGNQVLIRII